MSLLIVPLGPLSEFLYFRDYWNPPTILSTSLWLIPIYIEDIIFAFTIGGISSVIYEAVFKKSLVRSLKPIHKRVRLLVIFLIAFLTMIVLLKIGVNSIYASSIAFLILALFMIVQRHDLLSDAIVSGFAVMVTMFIAYTALYYFVTPTLAEQYLSQGWYLHQTSLSTRLFNIPLTEMIWGFSWGMAGGPLYEYIKNFKLK